MGGFLCPTCGQVRHIEENHNDPRLDHCWLCGTLVPYTPEEIDDMRADGLIPPDPERGPWIEGNTGRVGRTITVYIRSPLNPDEWTPVVDWEDKPDD
jgi:hypothetical protein